MSRVIHTVTATVPVPIERVFDGIVAAVTPGALKSEVDRERSFVAVQGGWWYRGEYALTCTPGGTQITHRVVNVARQGRWAVGLANRFFIGFGERTDAAFHQLVQAIIRG
jgi:hypothetical protein